MITIRNDFCIMCGTCAMVCPFKAITPGAAAMEPVPEKCTGCSLCASNCPVGAISVEKPGNK